MPKTNYNPWAYYWHWHWSAWDFGSTFRFNNGWPYMSYRVGPLEIRKYARL